MSGEWVLGESTLAYIVLDIPNQSKVQKCLETGETKFPEYSGKLNFQGILFLFLDIQGVLLFFLFLDDFWIKWVLLFLLFLDAFWIKGVLLFLLFPDALRIKGVLLFFLILNDFWIKEFCCFSCFWVTFWIFCQLRSEGSSLAFNLKICSGWCQIVSHLHAGHGAVKRRWGDKWLMRMIRAFTSCTALPTITSIGHRLTARCALMEIRSTEDGGAGFLLKNLPKLSLQSSGDLCPELLVDKVQNICMCLNMDLQQNLARPDSTDWQRPPLPASSRVVYFPRAACQSPPAWNQAGERMGMGWGQIRWISMRTVLYKFVTFSFEQT